MTLFFRRLADADTAADAAVDPSRFGEAFYETAARAAVEAPLRDWLARRLARLADDPLDAVARRERMRLANPCYVPRNWLVQEAIDRAAQGDPDGVSELLEVMRRPYEEQPGRESHARRRPEWARDRAGCSMLSCSS